MNKDGSIDSSFKKGYVGANGILKIAIDSKDRIYLGGQFFDYNESDLDGIVRLKSNGELDTSFTIPLPLNPTVSAIEILNDSAILIGQSMIYTGDALKLFDESGSVIDTTFTQFNEGSSVFSSSYNFGTLCLGGRFITGGDHQISPIAFMTYKNSDKIKQHIVYKTPFFKTYGENAFKPEALASSGMLVDFDSTDPNVITITNGVAEIHGAGTVALRIYQQGNAQYLSADTTVMVAVNKANQTITFDSISEKFSNGTPFELKASASSGLPLQMFSSDESIAKIQGMQVTILSAGEVTITAEQPGNKNYIQADPISRSFSVKLIAGTESSLNSSLNVYPNPGNGQYTIDMNASFQYFDALLVAADGRTTKVSLNHSDGIAYLDISNLANGLYILNIQSDQGTIRKRIIKQ